MQGLEFNIELIEILDSEGRLQRPLPAARFRGTPAAPIASSSART